MASTKAKLSLGEQIDRASDGRKQTWIVGKMQEAGINITEVLFSRKKKGHEEFTSEELASLSEILGTEIKA